MFGGLRKTCCTCSMAAMVTISWLHLNLPEESSILAIIGSNGNSAIWLPNGSVNLLLLSMASTTRQRYSRARASSSRLTFIRNREWGEEGYFRIERGQNNLAIEQSVVGGTVDKWF